MAFRGRLIAATPAMSGFLVFLAVLDLAREGREGHDYYRSLTISSKWRPLNLEPHLLVAEIYPLTAFAAKETAEEKQSSSERLRTVRQQFVG